MMITVFTSKNIDIPDKLVNDFITNVGPFSVQTAEYLAVSGDCSENNPAKETEAVVIEGMNEEIEIYKERDNIILAAAEAGGVASTELINVNYPSPKGNGLVTALWYSGLLLPHLVV